MAGTIGLGLWVSRSNTSSKDYLLGGGKMGWFVVGVSLIATSMSASTFLGLPTFSYDHSFSLLLNQVGALVSVVIVARYFIPRYRKGNLASAYELLEQCFGKSVRRLGAVLYCFHLLLRSGILIFGPALVLSKVMGMSIESTICYTAFISMIYTAFGGLKAVVLTDTIQFLVLLLGALLTLFTLHHLGDWSTLWTVASDASRTNILPMDNTVEAWLSPAQADSFLSATLIYTVLEVAIRGCDQQFVQRYLACSSRDEAVRSSYLSILIGIPAALLFFCIGALLYAYYQTQGVSMVANEAFPHFIMTELPSGIRGLLVAAIFAASMSSFDSAINALNNTTLVDLMNIDRDSPKSLLIARWVSIPWGLCALMTALLAAWAGKGLLYQALYFTSLFTGPLLALMTMAFYRPNYHSRSILGGVLMGMSLLVLISPPAWLDWHEPWLSWPYNPLISCMGTWLSAMLLEWLASDKKSKDAVR
jgi:SSS family solute:Na+ symporter